MLKKINTTSIVVADIILMFLVLIAAFFIWQKKSLPDDQVLAKEIIALCQGNSWHDCYQQELPKVTKHYGLKLGEQVLLAIQEADDNAKNCHVIAHFMAREAYNRGPDQFDQLLSSLNVNACGSGYLHGVLEAYVNNHPDVEVNGEFVNTICAKGQDPYWQRMCVHFMGHIFLVDEYGELDPALPKCETLKPEQQFDCYDGLFMEDHQKLALSEHEIAPLPNLTPEYMASMEETCNNYSGQKGLACWTEMAEMYAHAYGYIPQVIYEGCDKAPTSPYRKACYGKGVVVTSIYSGFDTPEKLLGICKFYEVQSDYRWCNDSILSSLMYYSTKYADRGIVLCANLPENDRTWCFASLGEKLKNFVPNIEERQVLCQTASNEYRKYCVN